MKTAMQELIERNEKHQWGLPKQVLVELLEKEKEQIASGYEAGYYYRFEGGEDYYSKTYKPLNNDQ